jgi:hypothetical protein
MNIYEEWSMIERERLVDAYTDLLLNLTIYQWSPASPGRASEPVIGARRRTAAMRMPTAC